MTLGAYFRSFAPDRRDAIVTAYLDAIGTGRATLARWAVRNGRAWAVGRGMA